MQNATSIKETTQGATSNQETVDKSQDGESDFYNPFTVVEDQPVVKSEESSEQAEEAGTEEPEETSTEEPEEEETEDTATDVDESEEEEEEEEETEESPNQEVSNSDWKSKYDNKEKEHTDLLARVKTLETYNGNLSNQVGTLRNLEKKLETLESTKESKPVSPATKTDVEKLLIEEMNFEEEQVTGMKSLVSAIIAEERQSLDLKSKRESMKKSFDMAEAEIMKEITETKGDVASIATQMYKAASICPDLYLIEVSGQQQYAGAEALQSCYQTVKQNMEHKKLIDENKFLREQHEKGKKNIKKIKKNKVVKDKMQPNKMSKPASKSPPNEGDKETTFFNPYQAVAS